MTFHIRNPIRRHGENPSSGFAMIPNELARDMTLSNHSYRIAVEIRTHAEGFEVSAKGIASDHGWGRTTVRKALDELVEARWLAVSRYLTASGKRAFDEYNVHASRRFTEQESAELNRIVRLPAGDASVDPTPLDPKEATGWTVREQPPGSRRDTKEDQLEHYSEDKLENQSPQCWICEGRGALGRPCENCGPECVLQPIRSDEQASDDLDCFGCKELGREGCMNHTSAPVGRQQLAAARR